MLIIKEHAPAIQKKGCVSSIGALNFEVIMQCEVFTMKIKFLFALIISLFVCGLAFAQTLPFNGQPTPPSVPTPKGYMLGPGDEVTVKVLGEPQFDFVTTVNEDGKIEVPFSNTPINAKCRTEKELRTDVAGLLGKYLKDPQLGLQVKRNSRPPALISGEVNTPTQTPVNRKMTLMEFISIAGGVKEEAGGIVQVFRTTTPLCGEGGEGSDWKADPANPSDVPSKLFSLSNMRLGKDDANPVILPGDQIFVHKAFPIFVTGEVVAPQGIYLKEAGLSLTEAIAKLGGIRPGAKTKDIKIYRLKPNTDPGSVKDREIISANYDLIKKGEQKDIMLAQNDIIEVDKAKESVAMQMFKFAIGVGKAGITAAGTGGGYRVLY